MLDFAAVGTSPDADKLCELIMFTLTTYQGESPSAGEHRLTRRDRYLGMKRSPATVTVNDTELNHHECTAQTL
jgi:hypothetical protein